MEKKTHLVSLCLALLTSTALIACCRPFSPSPKSLPEPTPEEARGWVLIPLEVTKTSTGEGWAQLHVEFAVRNDTGDWGQMFTSAIDAGSPGVTTAEGYSYQCRPFDVDSEYTLPPGFQVRGDAGGGVVEGQTSYVECEVAEESSGYSLDIPFLYEVGFGRRNEPSSYSYGTAHIDLGEAHQTQSYPVASTPGVHVYSVGEPIALHNGTLTLNVVSRTDDTVSLDWAFSNASGGYETELDRRFAVLGDDGMVYDYSPDLRWENPTAGPGQEISIRDRIMVPVDIGKLHLLLHVYTPESDMYTGYVIDLASAP